MPAPKWLARANRRVTNRILGPLAWHLPGFGVVIHRGRVTGAEHRTPVNVFRRPGGVTVALTYGSDSQWVRNVVAAGGCELVTGGRAQTLTTPVVVRDESRRGVPFLVRLPLALLGVSEFLELSSTGGTDR